LAAGSMTRALVIQRAGMLFKISKSKFQTPKHGPPPANI
jgi:hypothetical protein